VNLILFIGFIKGIGDGDGGIGGRLLVKGCLVIGMLRILGCSVYVGRQLGIQNNRRLVSTRRR
jgi:hypothetical protein